MSTLIFAGVAIFFVWKLRSVLGQKSGTEGRKPDAPARDGGQADAAPMVDSGNVIRLPGASAGPVPAAAEDRWAGYADRSSNVWNGLEAIGERDSAFSAKSFVDGARGAYEMIVGAFAAADRKTLKSLLSPDVFDSFAQAISQREARGESMSTTFVSIDKATLVDAQLRGPTAQLSVRFLSKLINTTTDRAGQPVDDKQGKVIDSVDVWSFARDTTSRNPNWTLVATESDQTGPSNSLH